MKIKNILSGVVALAAVALTGCDSEKELVIIDGQLPLKTSTLFMVGDATPSGWSIDSPTPMTQSEADPLVFDWEGSLSKGELKLCLTTGNWDAGFIRPMENGRTISAEDITGEAFDMHAGDPDNKWVISEAGKYRLSFNLRDWTYSTTFLGAADKPVVEPIATEQLYMVGDATPAGWNIDSPTELTRVSDYIFTYEGDLTTGEIKACLTSGSWDVSFIRPEENGTRITKDGVETPDFVFTANPDNKWVVADPGKYLLTFDLEHWTIKAEYLAAPPAVEKNPIETQTLFMIGDATPNGWSMDDAIEFTPDSSNRYIFVWEGNLVTGSFKACLERDGTFSCPFIRPSSADVEINKSGVAADDFVFTTSPDDQWKVTEAGRYRITFDLEHWTINVEAI